MKRKFFILLLGCCLCCTLVSAQNAAKSELHQRAESEDEKGNVAAARYNYIRAFEDYAGKGNIEQAVECGTKGTVLYYKTENLYQEAFDLLRQVDQAISASRQPSAKAAALYYQTSKQRMQMYIKLRKPDSAKNQLASMENHANKAADDALANDLLYNKAIYHYTFGQNEQGNAVFKEMAAKLTAQKEYDKVDEVYQTLIANGRRSNSASLVAQTYKNYMAWKDSVSAQKTADEIRALKQQIADNEASIADKDSSLTARWVIIVGLGILAAALAAALIIGAFVLMRFILLTRRQKNVIRMANENNALKAKFISNISAQLEPTLKKLDSRTPEVKALQDFTSHIQTLSALECSDEAVEFEETSIQPFCEGLMNAVRDKVKGDVNLKVDAPKLSASIHKEYVSHILTHLLNNAVEYVAEGGTIALEYKRRSAHTFQFLVSNTGAPIPEEKREDIFKPFLEIRDLTVSDGLGLPICKQMAVKMNGDLVVDPDFTKGTRFILELYS